MKFLPSLPIVCLIAALLFPMAAIAESIQDVLLSYEWQWQDSGRPTQRHGRFDPNGNFRNPSGAGRTIFRWEVTSPRTFTLRMNNLVTEYTFDESLTRFEGANPGGNRSHVVGTRLGRATEAIPPSAPSAPSDVSVSSVSMKSHLDAFAATISTASQWITAPLNYPMPASVKQGVATLAENLKDEAAKTPQASPQAYGEALKMCNILLAVLKERDATLETNKRTNNGKLSDAWITQWAARVDRVPPVLESTYTSFREAVRQSPKPAVPLTRAVLAPDFPPIPATASVSTQINPGTGSGAGAPRGPNPLDKGAYNRTNIWGYRGWIWRY